MNKGEYIVAMRTLREMLKTGEYEKEKAHELINRCLNIGGRLFDVIEPLEKLPEAPHLTGAKILENGVQNTMSDLDGKALYELLIQYGEWRREREYEEAHAKEEARWDEGRLLPQEQFKREYLGDFPPQQHDPEL